ncbi:hypothetical protein BCR42DRAFT_419922 [Absidia repens]|uniref:Nucleotide-diphospho-sugar transferase n=1 Tax=Absidia repens TaxID=90262 RepID=A0A1X2IAH0_9FUNG|nr:hypothetical protein BCR42DRAFT_419922 [Absidia repens]
MVWFFSSSSTNKYLPVGTVWTRRNRRGILNILRWLVIGILFALFSFLVICRLELNARLYIREWITLSKPTEAEPLSTFCFGNTNTTTATSSSTTPTKKYVYNFIPGIPVWEEYTCYDYAYLLQPLPSTDDSITTFHTTWSSQLQRSDQLTTTHLATLRSFMATQPLNSSQLIVWIHPDDEEKLVSDPFWKKAANTKTRYQVYSDELTTGTPLEPAAIAAATAAQAAAAGSSSSSSGSKHMETESDDSNNGLMGYTTMVSDPELLKLAVLYQHGGVWFDLNTLFVRDMTPLLGHEWIAQGKCQTSMAGNPFEGSGLWHFYPQSRAVCELLYGTTKSRSNNNSNNIKNNNKITKTIFGATGKSGRGTRGAELYQRIYQNLLRNGQKPWSTLPWCFTDPTNCKASNSLPSPLDQADFSPLRLRQTFAVHFDQPKKQTQSGSIYRYLQEAQQW